MYQSNPQNGHTNHRPHNQPKPPVTVVGIPSVAIQNNRLVVGSSQTSSVRSYTPLKVLGDGSFGTVWLCDWHGTLPPNTPLSPMQCGPGARPEWQGKRLVAVKRMKKQWEGGWDECQKLKELESLRAIPFHPNIIPLYDFFLLPATKELYFVFESMEGNLYHLIKARKGRPLAGGLVASIFQQMSAGLFHIHEAGYFHRDMKPENVLVTTVGLHDYVSVSPLAQPTTPPEKDVVAIIKLADFGLARETKSKPPYTEYVSTRWYRAPEVLLLSRDYSNPVDMWAVGTIMAELVNLRPLFPGSGQVDQVARICEILGDPSEDYGVDAHGSPIGGGKWPRGIKLAKAVGFSFPKIPPRDFYALFDKNVPPSLIHLIIQLLRYDPDVRLTSAQCLQSQYLRDILPRNRIPIPASLQITIPWSTTTQKVNGAVASTPLDSYSPRSIPPSHSIPDASTTHRAPFYAPTVSSTTPQSSVNGLGVYPQASASDLIPEGQHPHDYTMEISPQAERPDLFPPNGVPMEQEPTAQAANGHDAAPSQGPKRSFLGKKWGKVFGDKHQLSAVDEVPSGAPGASTSHLKRPSSPSDGQPDQSPVIDSQLSDVKKNKKEAQRVAREAEKQRRALAEKMQREQARAVMVKRSAMMQKTTGNDIEWMGHGSEPRPAANDKGKQASTGPIRQNQANGRGSATINAAAGSYGQPTESLGGDWRRDERMTKVRRQEFDDGLSTMSSSDVHSIGRLSSISFATVDSDPGPNRLRTRPSLFGINRMTSTSSLRTSFDDFPTSARSSNSFSLEGQLANDFRIQASVDPVTPLSGSLSPPPIHMLSLSPSLSPQLPSSPPWIQVQQPNDILNPSQDQFQITIPPSLSPHLNGNGRHSPYHSNNPMLNHPSSPCFDQKANINPMFKVVSYIPTIDKSDPSILTDFIQSPLPLSSDSDLSSTTALPPFRHLEAVAEHEYPPLSPMAFHIPEEETT
ncbi:hypothetical protein HGRIS_007928 [Hohenbuehelia grisea]|uniref:Protein kinase domain-containing protein n=1 Tax=Hohenbuehelia grisea TaxID=104357 RepID=A0ABR3J6E4_9AGAR